jgi:hypothetical protein
MSTPINIDTKKNEALWCACYKGISNSKVVNKLEEFSSSLNSDQAQASEEELEEIRKVLHTALLG